MASLYNLTGMTSATTGTGATIALSGTLPDRLSFAQAGAVDGATITYAIEDGVNREIGRAVYNAAGPSLTERSVLNSTSGNAPINLSGTALIFVAVAAEDGRESSQVIYTSGSSLSINYSKGAYVTLYLGHNITSFNIDHWPNSGRARMTIKVCNLGTFNIIFPSTWLAEGGQEPTITPGVDRKDIYTFASDNSGTTVYIYVEGQDFAEIGSVVTLALHPALFIPTPIDLFPAPALLYIEVPPDPPVVTWVEESTDSAPDFDIGLPSGFGDGRDAAAGDDLIIERSTDPATTWTLYLTHTLTTGDLTDDEIELEAADLPNGDYLFRARLDRGSGSVSGNSNLEPVTIEVV